MKKLDVTLVSVPWRGLGSFGHQDYERILAAQDVSVPWRGLGSFGLSYLVVLHRLFLKFPSPGGD